MNNAQKIVFSNTLETADWVNSRLATGTPEEEIARLREQGVENVGVAGGARFAQYLSSRGLIDEYRLSVHPIALGAGLPLFTTTVPLRLIGSRTYATGLTTNRYVRRIRPRPGDRRSRPRPRPRGGLSPSASLNAYAVHNHSRFPCWM